jgi:hypothetical protein
MQGSDNTAELRARHRATVIRTPRQRKVHDFRNRLAEYCFAVQLQQESLIAFYGGELTALYEAALRGKK